MKYVTRRVTSESDMANNMDLENTMEIDLIPVGEYQESSNHDGSKCYTCSRCGRMFTVKNGPMGIKQHLVQVHVANGEFQVS